MMSVAFTREESAQTAAEVELPDRPISPHANLVTASGPEALANAMAEYRAAYNAAHQIEDVTERRRARPRWPSVRIPSAPPIGVILYCNINSLSGRILLLPDLFPDADGVRGTGQTASEKELARRYGACMIDGGSGSRRGHSDKKDSPNFSGEPGGKSLFSQTPRVSPSTISTSPTRTRMALAGS
jgi:hypothetical protein